jgi:hypothetical protein
LCAATTIPHPRGSAAFFAQREAVGAFLCKNPQNTALFYKTGGAQKAAVDLASAPF